MNLRIEVSKIKNLLLYCLLFLAAMNFQAKFFYFVYFSLFLVVVTQKTLRIDRMSILYLVTCGIMAVYNHKEGMLAMLRCFAPFCFYLVGLNFISAFYRQGGAMETLGTVEMPGYRLLVAISAGSFAHYALNYLNNLGDSLGRNTIDIWSGARMAATGQNALACLMMGLSVSMLCLPRKQWHRITAIAVIALMLLYNLVLSTRTMIVILAALLLIGVCYPKKHVLSKKQRMRSAFTIGMIAAMVALVFLMNVGAIRDYIKDSLFFNRINGTIRSMFDNGTRTSIKLQFLKNMYRYPFGGMHMRAKFAYAHDLLLDGYDEYGVGVFALLIAMLIHGGLQVYKIVCRSAYSDYYKLALLLVYAAILLEFTVEPILAGMQWLFACYCLINGCITGLNRACYRYEKGAYNRRNESITD